MTGEPAVPVEGGATGAGAGGFARVWVKALDRVDYVPLPIAERVRVVAGLARRLAAALRAEPFDAGRLSGEAERVAADLVGCDYAAPEVLACTLTLIHTRLAGDLGLAGDDAAVRMPVLVAGVAAGFAAAVRDRTLDA